MILYVIFIGVSIGTSVGGSSVQLSINKYGTQVSDWGFSDVVVWNRVLPYAEMKKVSDAMLKSVCGGGHYWNSETNVCTACPIGSNSTGDGCLCKELGYYWNSVTSVYTSCPIGSNSTGSVCVCNQDGYFFNYVTNICIACPVGSNTTETSCICNEIS